MIDNLTLEGENSLRTLIASLLNEKALPVSKRANDSKHRS